MYPSIIQSTVDSEKDLSNADRDEIVRLLVEKEKAFNKKFNKRIKEELDFGQFIESTFYPLYAKFFTVKELSDLLKFYNSPVGQKFNKISPEFGAETVKLTQEYMLPTIMKIVKEIVDEDIESAKQNADASEGK